MNFNPKRAYAALSLNARICAGATALAVLSLAVTEAVTAYKSSASAESASLNLARATLREAAAALQGRIGSDLSAVITMARVVRATKAVGKPLGREQLGEVSKATLLGSQDLLGAAITFEPNALDGKDARYAGQKPLYDHTGRYMPYWTRNGSSVSVEPIVFSSAPGANDWYDIPRQTGKVYFTEPYAYTVNGKEVQMASLVAPIEVDGKFIGVASADFMLDRLGTILKELKSVEGSQLALVSNGGLYASNPDPKLIGKPATDIPPAGRENARQGKAFEYSDSEGMVHMLQPLYLHADIAPWAVKLTYPRTVVTAPARELLLYTVVVSVLCALAMAALLIILVNRLMQPLHALGAAMTSLSSGNADLSVRLSVHGKDELAAIGDGFNRFMAKIQSVLIQVRSTSDIVATASTEISHGNAALSSRTEQQAGSLEETAASMEELTSTVRQNAENARQASQFATAASEIALRGKGKVAQVVQTMGSINDSSKRVVDIINVIDGIAFQTNILALNAAVEAARAGAQGRGFAVVASEVRNLAQRSAGAAKEIKDLINASVGQVEVGTSLVADAGRTMEEIVSSIMRVTSIIGEIAEASTEQSIGIAQVNQAIVEMDDVTQQNAALVEQAAAASATLRDESAALLSLLWEFRLMEQEQRGLAVSEKPPKVGKRILVTSSI